MPLKHKITKSHENFLLGIFRNENRKQVLTFIRILLFQDDCKG
jgi:hypothetical protein